MSSDKRGNSNALLNTLKAIGSLKLTVIGLLILTVLVIWGTLYQADNGLYQAQQKFFHSFFFFIFGFIPFPGTVLVMFVLFINLVFALIFRIGFRWSNLGNLVTHGGFIVLLAGGFFTFFYSVESTLMLREGELSSRSESRQIWELALWQANESPVTVYATDANGLDEDQRLGFQDLNLDIRVGRFYRNCTPLMDGDRSQNAVNSSGIRALSAKPEAQENSENVAGLQIFVRSGNKNEESNVILYGGDRHPTSLGEGKTSYRFSLRRKRILLPISIRLKDFRVKHYPNSNIVKSYESFVSIKDPKGTERDVLISMNKPLRYEDLTFFQSSYFIDRNGTEFSIFAVVKNSGRLLPYISSLLIFLGLVIHFIAMMVRRKRSGK